MLTAITIDYGHGAETPGKRYTFDDANGRLVVREWELNRRIAARTIGRLLDAGVPVLDAVAGHAWLESPPEWDALPRADVPLRDRIAYANEHPRALLLSIHCDAYGHSHVGPGYPYRGSTLHVAPDASPAAREAAWAIVEALEHHYEREPMQVRPDPVRRSRFAVLTRTTDPAVLLECGFMTNRLDAEWLSTRGPEVISAALADALKPLVAMAPKSEINADRAQLAALGAKAEVKAGRVPFAGRARR